MNNKFDHLDAVLKRHDLLIHPKLPKQYRLALSSSKLSEVEKGNLALVLQNTINLIKNVEFAREIIILSVSLLQRQSVYANSVIKILERVDITDKFNDFLRYHLETFSAERRHSNPLITLCISLSDAIIKATIEVLTNKSTEVFHEGTESMAEEIINLTKNGMFDTPKISIHPKQTFESVVGHSLDSLLEEGVDEIFINSEFFGNEHVQNNQRRRRISMESIFSNDSDLSIEEQKYIENTVVEIEEYEKEEVIIKRDVKSESDVKPEEDVIKYIRDVKSESDVEEAVKQLFLE